VSTRLYTTPQAYIAYKDLFLQSRFGKIPGWIFMAAYQMQISHNASSNSSSTYLRRQCGLFYRDDCNNPNWGNAVSQNACPYTLCLWSVGAGNLQLDPVPISSGSQCSEPLRETITSPCSSPSDPCRGVSIKLPKRALVGQSNYPPNRVHLEVDN
jgi:hypothetical protein